MYDELMDSGSKLTKLWKQIIYLKKWNMEIFASAYTTISWKYRQTFESMNA